MNKITASNLPRLGIEPYKKYGSDGELTDVFYAFLNGSTVDIHFDFTGKVERIFYNGMVIPNNAQLEVIDERLHIIISTV